MRLVGAVRAPKLLDRLVRAPGQLVRQVHPLPLVLRAPAWDGDRTRGSAFHTSLSGAPHSYFNHLILRISGRELTFLLTPGPCPEGVGA